MSVAIVASRLATGSASHAASRDHGRRRTAAPAERAVRRSRRDRLRGEHSQQPEPAAMLTADRLLEVNRKTRPGPEGRWQRFVYDVTFRTVNLGDSAKVRARKELDHRIQKQFEGGARFVPVLTRKGGVGKTTVTTLLGMALADAREDRIVAIDANPDRGTLSERVPQADPGHGAGCRAQGREHRRLHRLLGARVARRDPPRHPRVGHRPDAVRGVRRERLQRRRRPVGAVLLDRAHRLRHRHRPLGDARHAAARRLVVIVSGGSVDEARLASETLTWLEANGYGDLVRNAVVALNTATHGTNLVKLEEIESHFRSRVREIVRIPYDPQLAAGSVVSWKDLKPLTRCPRERWPRSSSRACPAERD